MDKTQVRKLTSIGLALIMVWFMTIQAGAVIRHWESFTSFNEVSDMTYYNGYVWAATKGGLVRIDSETMSYETYNNADGLNVNELYSLYVDGKNRLWVGGRGRLVDFSDPDHPDVYLFTDRDDVFVEIYDIAGTPGGDSLWLANRLGVTIFLAPEDKGTGLILDTYTRFAEIERDTPARRVALDSDSIWVGTEGGLAVGARNDIRLLKGPDGWQSYLPSQLAGISSDHVGGLVSLNDKIFVGTMTGAYRFDRGTSPSMDNIGLYGNPLVYNMSLIGDSILINDSRGSAFYYNGTIYEIPTQGMPIPNTSGGTVDGNGLYWDGNLLYGIYYRQDTEMIPFDAGGTPANECNGIIRAQGKIWGAFGNLSLAYYENGRWIEVPGVTGVFRDLAVGPLGELWVGTHGRGAYRVLGDSIAHFMHYNSGLSDIAKDTGQVVVPGIFASGDAIWFANYRGRDGELVAVNPFDLEQWQSYLLMGGENGDRTASVVVGQDIVYVGSEETGIYAVAYSGSPFYTADDYVWKFTSSNSGIGSDLINCLTVDGYDTLWVGTAFGLSYQALGEIFFTNIVLPFEFGPSITAIAFDAQGSLYAGSGRGLAVRDLATGAIECMTSKNSGLVDDDIVDICYDAGEDAFWISTTGGISKMTMPYRQGSKNIDNVLAYPNPFVIRYGTETVRFNYAGLAEVRIYTLAGELIKEIPVNGEWDGRNAAGEYVASGLYLFALTGSDGEVGRGKIILVRE